MDDRVAGVTRLLEEASDLHHRVYRITDGAHDDWASWYAEWLATLSELPQVVGTKVVPSELTYLLVKLGREYAEASPDEKWEAWYAQRIVDHFEAGRSES
ncbi:MAG: hypothetical protein ACRDJ4_14890 [Actinomycetota bacterium]